MKAFIINRYSKADKLQFTELPEPVVKENEVLVQIHSAGVNQLDAKIKSGDFKLLLPYKFPLVLGHDVAGIVTKVGAKVSRFKVGDAVFARPANAASQRNPGFALANDPAGNLADRWLRPFGSY